MSAGGNAASGTSISGGKYVAEGVYVGATQGLTPQSSKVIVEIDLEWPTPMGEGDPFIPEGAATLQEFWPARRDEIGPDVARDLALSDGMAAVPFAAVNQYRLDYAGRMLEKVRGEGIHVIASPTQAQTPPPTDALTICSMVCTVVIGSIGSMLVTICRADWMVTPGSSFSVLRTTVRAAIGCCSIV